ncbi:Arm DNA-binding domain-containing protein [Enterococcus casseliflavus]|uniref:Arm DNA-binding domain-containing protein n=1 Tax=Enterococcus casseliflavus TaxID=37734 RepID=UPI003A4C6F2A
MAILKQYKKSDGTTAWFYKLYMGKDPITGKERRTTRRGFKTKKEACLDLARLQLEIESKGLNNNSVRTYRELYNLWMSQHTLNIRNTTEQRVRNYFTNQILPFFWKHETGLYHSFYMSKNINRLGYKISIFSKN